MIEMMTGPLPLRARVKNWLWDVVFRVLHPLRRPKPHYLYITDEYGAHIVAKFRPDVVPEFHEWLSTWAVSIHQQGRGHAPQD